MSTMMTNPFANPAETFLKRTELARAKIDLATAAAKPKSVAPTLNEKRLTPEKIQEAKTSFDAALAAADPVAQAAAKVAALEAEAQQAGLTGGKPLVDTSIHYEEPDPEDDPAVIAKRKARLQRKKLGLEADAAEAEKDAIPDPTVKANRTTTGSGTGAGTGSGATATL